MFDLRTPSGLFFLLTGVIVGGTGLLSPARAALTATNVNLYAGAAMLAFGVILLALARRGA